MVLAKLVRGEERDVEYARAALRADILDRSVLKSRIPDLPVAAAIRDRVMSTVIGLAG